MFAAAIIVLYWLYFWLVATDFHLLPFSVSLQLFELLGPEGLEMISTLLQQRVAIVDSLTIPSDRTGYTPGEAAPWQPGHLHGNTNSTCIDCLR